MTLSPEAAAQRIEELEREYLRLEKENTHWQKVWAETAVLSRDVNFQNGVLWGENEQLKARISELESALEWKDIEKEKPPLAGLNVRYSTQVEVKKLTRGEWEYAHASWDYAIGCWDYPAGWTHWRIIQEEMKEKND